MEIRGNLALNDNALQDFNVDPKTGAFPDAVEGKLVYRTDLSNLFVCVQVVPSAIWYPLASTSALFVYNQVVGDNIWNINHSLGSSDVFVQVYDSGGYAVIPSEIVVVDDDWVRIEFAGVETGKVIIAALSEGDAQIGLGELSNVSISSPQAAEGIIYNSSNQQWENGYVFTSVEPHSETTAYSALENDQILADTLTTGAFIITLPTNPVVGARVFVFDEKSNFGTAACTVAPSSGEKIRGVEDDTVVLNVDDIITEFVWLGPTVGWTYR